ncbi:MAG: hypothetical protein AAFZ07_04840 [Actinomycetota bacterium]
MNERPPSDAPRFELHPVDPAGRSRTVGAASWPPSAVIASLVLGIAVIVLAVAVL